MVNGTIVSGHPGSTRRLLTAQQLAFERDGRLPFMLDWLQSMVDAIGAYGGSGDEEAARLARDELFRFNNSIKAMTGQVAGLRDQDLFKAKVAQEDALIAKVKADPKLDEQFGDAWDQIAKAHTRASVATSISTREVTRLRAASRPRERERQTANVRMVRSGGRHTHIRHPCRTRNAKFTG